MLTTAQAAATWCPMVRSTRGGANCDPHHGNRVPDGSTCIASKCAMWRWGEFKAVTKPCVVDAPENGPGGKKIGLETSNVPVSGYCGLAGRPV